MDRTSEHRERGRGHLSQLERKVCMYVCVVRVWAPVRGPQETGMRDWRRGREEQKPTRGSIFGLVTATGNKGSSPLGPQEELSGMPIGTAPKEQCVHQGLRPARSPGSAPLRPAYTGQC